MDEVIKGERPSTQNVITVPQYIDVMTECWSQVPSERPNFKTVRITIFVYICVHFI